MNKREAVIDPVAASWLGSEFLLGFFTSLFISVLLIVALSWVVDPFDIYGNNLFPPWQANRYAEKYDLYNKFEPPPEALIIGSSRVGSLDPLVVESITGHRCFHWGVPSAGVEAFNAIMELASEKKNANIKLIIIGVDPVSFEVGNPVQVQMLYEPHYTQYFHKTFRQRADSAIRLLTKEQTVTSAKVIIRSLGAFGNRLAPDHRADGFPLYSNREEAISKGAFDFEKNLDLRLAMYPGGFTCITGESKISESNKRLWEQFLEKCRDRGIKVYAFMPVEHPRLYEKMESLGSIPVYEEIAQYLRATVEGADGIFMDFTELDSFNGDMAGFYDEVHMRKPNGDLLLQQLFNGTPERSD